MKHPLRSSAALRRTFGLFLRDGDRYQLLLMAAVVGVCSSGAAVVLTRGLAIGNEALDRARYLPYGFLLPAAGAALSVLALRSVFRESGGHGVTEVVYSVSRRGGLLRLRSAFSRLIGSMLTIVTGGSAGPEAPVAISGSSIASNISVAFGVTDRQRLVLVACGAAGAIAAIFNAPMAGIAFSLEAILGEWSSTNLVPIAVSSVVATELSRILQGNQIPFDHQPFDTSVWDVTAALGLAIPCAIGAVAFVWSLKHVERFSSQREKAPAWLRAALGGLLVGALGRLTPIVLGEGYETVRRVIHGELEGGLAIFALATVAKIGATALTIGSGGSGGVFAPCLVIGSLVGVLYRRAIGALPLGMPMGDDRLFALLGMAGLVSSVLQAPLTGIFLIVEITGSYNLIVPVVLVAVTAATISHCVYPHSIYHEELVARGVLLLPRTDARVLAEFNLLELVDTSAVPVRPGVRLENLVTLFERTSQRFFPVVEPQTSRLVGVVDVDRIRPYLLQPALYRTLLVEELVDERLAPVGLDEDLASVMDRFEMSGVQCFPVVQGKRFLGLLLKYQLLDRYRKELIVQENS